MLRGAEPRRVIMGAAEVAINTWRTRTFGVTLIEYKVYESLCILEMKVWDNYRKLKKKSTQNFVHRHWCSPAERGGGKAEFILYRDGELRAFKLVTAWTSLAQGEGCSFKSEQQGFGAHFQVQIRADLETTDILPLLGWSLGFLMKSGYVKSSSHHPNGTKKFQKKSISGFPRQF